CAREGPYTVSTMTEYFDFW
nr:immunoglobulin heavy chain junction region [Macaca mulatta]MOV91134.1 immunoglobulin heavy chain junction region [Macaca mulatta]MOV91823.1 immunoglobulin heavy chain junction region [Macaca mulatta]